MNYSTYAAIRAWSQWLGQPGITRDVVQKPNARNAPTPEFLAPYEHLFAAAATALFAPPSENLPPTEIARYKRAAVDAIFHDIARLLGVRPAPFWPGDAPYAVCVTHDIDRTHATFHALTAGAIPKGERPRQMWHDIGTWLRGDSAENPFYNFQRVYALERSFGVPSASYLLFERRRPWKALLAREPQHALGVYDPADIADTLKQYVEHGGEVGLHGSFDSWNSGAALRREMHRTETLGLPRPVGVRNHYLQFAPTTSIRAQESAGLSYDSSVGFNFGNGFRSGTSFPYFLGSVLELPLHLMDSAMLAEARDPREFPRNVFPVLSEVRHQGGLLMLNWHVHRCHDRFYPRNLATLEALLRAAVSDGAWIARPMDVAQHWRDRQRRMVETTSDGEAAIHLARVKVS